MHMQVQSERKTSTQTKRKEKNQLDSETIRAPQPHMSHAIRIGVLPPSQESFERLSHFIAYGKLISLRLTFSLALPVMILIQSKIKERYIRKVVREIWSNC